MDKLGVEAGPLCSAHLASQDSAHVHAASYKVSEKVKQKRKFKRRKKNGEEGCKVGAQ